jgi:hypothetical protein
VFAPMKAVEIRLRTLAGFGDDANKPFGQGGR